MRPALSTGARPAAISPVAKPAAAPSKVGQQAANIAEASFSSRDRFKMTVEGLATISDLNLSPDPEMVELNNLLKSRQLRLGDYSIYVAKHVGGQRSVNLFESQDRMDIGISSLQNATIAPGHYFVIDSITLLGHVYQAGDVDPGDPLAVPAVPSTDPALLVPGTPAERAAILHAPFGSLSGLRAPGFAGASQAALAIVANGVLTLKTKRHRLLDELNCGRFVQDNNLGTGTGTLRLDNPILLRSQDILDLELALGKAATANTLVKVYLNGTGTVQI